MAKNKSITPTTKRNATWDLVGKSANTKKITDALGGVVGAEYEDLTGQGRIVIVEEQP